METAPATPKGVREAPVTPWTAAADAQINNPARTLGFALGLGLVFVRFSMLHELLAYVFGARFMLQYIFGIPAMLALVGTGGIWRIYQGSTAYYWTAYALWMFAAAPFSSWKGASLGLALRYFRTEFVAFLVMAGLAITWRECRMMLRTIAWGGMIALAAARFFRDSVHERRFGLVSGTVANPNDYACVLVLLLPFILWLGLSSKWVVLRAAVFPVLAYGVYVILSTASRGALVALLAEAALFVYLGTARQRVALLALGAILVPAVLAMVPQGRLRRITAFSRQSVDSEEAVEAGQSRAVREYVLRKSIEYTIENPLFGVGPGQMTNYEGQRSKTLRSPGIWQNAHNTLLQASSECGIPALIFFIGGLVSTYRRLNATYRKARARPDCADIRTAVFCVMVGMGGFCVAAAFLNFAYLFYTPALGALAIVISPAAEREFETRNAAVASTLPSRGFMAPYQA